MRDPRAAGFGLRLHAAAIDWGICTGLFFASAMVVAVISGGEADSAWSTAALVLLASTAVIAYFTYFWARSGATPGMRSARLHLEADEGRPLMLMRLVLRAVAALVSGASVLVILVTVFSDSPNGYSSGVLSLLVAALVVSGLSLIGHLWLLVDGRQTLQDRLFRLVVVPVEARDATSPSAATPAPPD